MNEELKRLGGMLRTKRKELGLSLREIENTTSIRAPYLEAIEDGRIEDYISGIYAQGFLRQYAHCLGFDMDGLVRDYPGAFRILPEKHDFAYGIGTLEVRGSLGGGVKWLPNLMWASLAAVICVGAYFFAKFLGVL